MNDFVYKRNLESENEIEVTVLVDKGLGKTSGELELHGVSYSVSPLFIYVFVIIL